MQVHRNAIKCLLHSNGNNDKIFCKNVNNIFHVENSGVLIPKNEFFLADLNCWEYTNKYIVINEDGSQLFFLREESDCCARCDFT